jgi:hypothetical protein
MNWDQIESKWAAMTLRIRADWAVDRIETTRAPVRTPRGRDAAATVIKEARTEAANNTPEFKTATK